MVKSNTQKPLVIPIFLPNIGCVHRCIFCDQATITGGDHRLISADQFNEIVHTYLPYKNSRRRKTQISFYGGNFLGIKTSFLLSLLEEAARFIRKGDVDSIRFSTRPDTICRKTLDIIKDYPVSTLELGVQSMNDRVLQLINRGHTVRDTINAVRLLQQSGYEIGLQMMVGLPGDDEKGAFETARQIVALSPDFVRIYPTVVLANSPLAAWYKKGEYTPMPLASCVTLVKKIYGLFHDHHIRVVRMGLQASETLDNPEMILAGPYHPAFGHLVLSEFFLDKAVSALRSMQNLPHHICIKVHPQNLSKIRGLKNQNLGILKDRFNIETLKIISDMSLKADDLVLSGL